MKKEKETKEGFGTGFLSEEDLTELNRMFRGYLWYRPTGKGRREVVCSVCRKSKEVSVKDDGANYMMATAKHGHRVRCPMCGTMAEARSIDRSKSCRDMTEERTYMRVIKNERDNVVINCYGLWKCYTNGCNLDCLPRWTLCDSYLLKPGEAAQFGRKTIIEPFLCGYGCGMKHLEYTLPKYLFYGTFLEKCGMWEYNNEKNGCGQKIKYLCEFCKKPGLEQLTKAGYADIVAAYIDGNHFRGRMNMKGKKPSEILKMTKGDAEILKSGDVGRMDDVMNAYVGVLRDKGITLRDLKEFKEATKLPFYKIEELLQTYGDLKKLKRYLERQFDKANAEAAETCHAAYAIRPTIERVAITLTDYRRMAKNAGYKVEDYPRDLFAAHNDLMSRESERRAEEWKKQNQAMEEDARKRWEETTRIKEERAEEFDRKYEQRLAKNFRRRVKMWGGFHDKTYMIVVPERATDLVKEGAALHHCVGGYAEKFDKGDSDIVFIRRIERLEQPLLTVEIVKDGDGYRMNQCYGFNDDRQLSGTELWLADNEKKWRENYEESCRWFADEFGKFIKKINRKEETKNGNERKRA